LGKFWWKYSTSDSNGIFETVYEIFMPLCKLGFTTGMGEICFGGRHLNRISIISALRFVVHMVIRPYLKQNFAGQIFVSGLLDFWTLSIVRYSKKHSMSGRVGGFFFDGPNRVGVSHLLT
jgi:hypothetical protein